MKANDTDIMKFIAGFDKVFLIPPFQRNYDWTSEQCEELFEDIKKSYQCKSSHYLGNIIYYMSENSGVSYQEFVLIDGQQRITTILLLLCALRDVCNEQWLIDQINTRYLINPTSDVRFRVRLKQTAYDTDSFTAIINKDLTIAKENNVVKNYHLFKDLIVNSGIPCKDLYETLSRLEMVDINLQINNDLNKIQTVFEKINSTGKRLTSADLIRNYLLLTNSFIEQEALYTNYWIKIERIIGSENISKFSRDYLIMKVYEDFAEELTYKRFKEHFNGINIAHIDILKEMYAYSDYYSWIINQNCPNKKINKILKYFKLLKTDDARPLYLYLFAQLYEKEQGELYRILNLLSDYLLRYRIVTPSGGGGALRSVIYQLLEKLNSEETLLTHESILYELSNSSAPSGRFPNDQEFIESLKFSVNTNYARVALIKLEEFEKHNISVDINEITIEHFMPQTRTSWWINYLGGAEEAERIYERYLNCIGNLGPISPSYNSQNSNKPWSEKLANIKNVQFFVTSETANNENWTEKEIIARNENISKRISRAIISPLPRERNYQIKGGAKDLVAGIYPISDLTTAMNGTSIHSIIYNNNVIEIDSWRDVLPCVCNILLQKSPETFENIVSVNKIHKATSTRNYPNKDPIITTRKELLVTPILIEGTNYYVEGCLSSSRVRFYTKQLAELFKVLDLFSLEISE